jgi:hypothetical protein
MFISNYHLKKKEGKTIEETRETIVISNSRRVKVQDQAKWSPSPLS